MLGVLCSARPKPWIVTSLFSSSIHHSSAVHHHLSRLIQGSSLSSLHFSDQLSRRRHHSSACNLDSSSAAGGAASIWHAIMPSGAARAARFHSDLRRAVMLLKGEGSWNAAWDARPARWLHRPDSAWILFGVCACLAPPDLADANPDAEPVSDDKIEDCESKATSNDSHDRVSAEYRVTGVAADGRCLFRAIAHGACLKKGEEAPDENRQRELADELRAQVVDELVKRREEIELYIDGDFDAYVERIQQPYVWGGEPELLMASHVLKTPISVFMRDQSSGDLQNITKYGKEYMKENESAINVLFHGYGHYDILETSSNQTL